MADSAQPTKLRINLNLLHPKEAPTKLPERFLKWLITYGRFIVIFVEVIVVAAFLTRFKLDADLDVLKTEINRDLPFIEKKANDEAEIKQAQAKLALIDTVYKSDDRWQEAVVNVSQQMPTSILLSSFSIEQVGGEDAQGKKIATDQKSVDFRINGSTTSNSDLGIFLNNLRSVETFKQIDLTTISFDKQQILFSISGKMTKP